MTEKPILPPYLALFIGVLAISTSAIFVKLSSSPPSIIATYRLLFTIILMIPFMIVARFTVRQSLSQLSARDYALCVLSGVVLAFHFIFWFSSFQYTSVASSVVLVTLQPLFTFIGSIWIFKENLSQRAWLGGVFAIIGAVVIGWGDFSLGVNVLYGDLLALFSAFLVSIYWLIGQHIRVRSDSGTYSFLVYSISTLTLFVYDLIHRDSMLSVPQLDWLWFLSLAIFPTLLGHSIFNWVIRWVPASVVSVSILGEALGSSILAYFIFRETVSVQQVMGGIILLLGILLFSRSHRTQPVAPNTQAQNA